MPGGPVRRDTADVLLLSFAEARLALVGFDPFSEQLRTLALLNFEDGATGPGSLVTASRGGRLSFPGAGGASVARVDHASRCAVMLVYGNQLVVLPFRKPHLGLDEEEEEDAGGAGAGGAADTAGGIQLDEMGLLNSQLTRTPYVVNLEEQGLGGRVIDYCFLEGYFQPTLLLLLEPNESHVRRLAFNPHSCRVVAISLDLARRQQPVIWSKEGLPQGCFRLEPVPSPIGGAIVFTPNAMLYFNQHHYSGLAVNGFARGTIDQTRYPLAGIEGGKGLSLDKAQTTFLSKDRFLLSLKGGEMFVATLESRSGTVQRIVVERSRFDSVQASCIATIPGRCFFLGSRHGDSLLISYANNSAAAAATTARGAPTASTPSGAYAAPAVADGETAVAAAAGAGDVELDEDDADLYGDEEDGDDAAGAAAAGGSGVATTRPPGPPVEQSPSKRARVEGEEDADLYGEADETAAPPKEESAAQWGSFAVVDSIPTFGPIADSTIGQSLTADESPVSAATPLELVAATGNTNDAALAQFSQSLRPEVLVSRIALAGVRAMWAVKHAPTAASANEDSDDEDDDDDNEGEGEGGGEGEGEGKDEGNVGAGEQGKETAAEAAAEEAAAPGDSAPPGEAAGAGDGNSPDASTTAASGAGGPGTGEVEGGDADVADDSSDDDDDDDEVDGEVDAFLFLSLDDRTIVLATSTNQIAPVDAKTSEFYTDGPTLAAGSLTFGTPPVGDDGERGVQQGRVVQVYAEGVRVLDGSRSTQELPLTEDIELGGLGVKGASIQSVSFADPWVLLRCSDGGVRLLKCSDSDGQLDVLQPTLEGTDDDEVCAASLFVDSSRELSAALSGSTGKTATSAARVDPTAPVEEDDDLYGDGDDTATNEVSQQVEPEGATATSQPTTFCVVARRSGALQICEIAAGDSPSLKVVFSCSDAARGPEVMRGVSEVAGSHTVRAGNQISEVSLINAPRPFVTMALANGDVLAYTLLASFREASAVDLTGGGEAKSGEDDLGPPLQPFACGGCRFGRLPLSVVTRAPAAVAGGDDPAGPSGGAPGIVAAEAGSDASVFQYPRLIPFRNVGGWAGVVYRSPSGGVPQWLVCERESLRHVAFQLAGGTTSPPDAGSDSHLSCFAPFHNQNCAHGFVYGHAGALLFAQLPARGAAEGVTIAGSMAVHKEPLVIDGKVAQVRKIEYLKLASAGGMRRPIYAALTSVQRSWSAAEDEEYWEEDREEYRKANLEPKAPMPNLVEPDALGEPDVKTAEYHLRLMQPRTAAEVAADEDRGRWQVLGSEGFDPFEHPICLASLHLAESEGSRLDPIVAVGTGYVPPFGEHAEGKGRIRMFRVSHVNVGDGTGEGASATQAKMKEVFNTQYNAPVSAIVQYRQYILVGIGQRIDMFEWYNLGFRQVGFYDTALLNVSLATMKDYVVFADFMESVQLLHWKKDIQNLRLLAKDVGRVESTVADFITYGPELGVVRADMDGNLQVFAYEPTKGATRLLPKGDFHLGSVVGSLQRVPLLGGPEFKFPQGAPPRVGAIPPTRVGQMFGTTDGGVGLLIPVTEAQYRRLATLKTLMMHTLPHTAGLNPRGFRLLQAPRQIGQRMKHIEDGVMLWRYLALDSRFQRDLARGIGTTVDKLVQTLRSLEWALPDAFW